MIIRLLKAVSSTDWKAVNMSDKDPYKDSNYDSAGMPLGTKVVDTGLEVEQRRFASVKQVIPPEDTTTLVDNDYEEPVIDKKEVDESKFNGAIELPLEKQPEGDEKEAAIKAIDDAKTKQEKEDDALLNDKGEVKEEAKPEVKEEAKK